METHIKDSPGLVRDEKSGAIINTNMDGYNIILEKRRHDREMAELQQKLQDQAEMIEKLAKVLDK